MALPASCETTALSVVLPGLDPGIQGPRARRMPPLDPRHKGGDDDGGPRAQGTRRLIQIDAASPSPRPRGEGGPKGRMRGCPATTSDIKSDHRPAMTPHPPLRGTFSPEGEKEGDDDGKRIAGSTDVPSPSLSGRGSLAPKHPINERIGISGCLRGDILPVADLETIEAGFIP